MMVHALTESGAVTVLSHFLAHTPLLENKCTEGNYKIYNIGTPAFSIISQNAFFLYMVRVANSNSFRCNITDHELR